MRQFKRSESLKAAKVFVKSQISSLVLTFSVTGCKYFSKQTLTFESSIHMFCKSHVYLENSGRNRSKRGSKVCKSYVYLQNSNTGVRKVWVLDFYFLTFNKGLFRTSALRI